MTEPEKNDFPFKVIIDSRVPWNEVWFVSYNRWRDELSIDGKIINLGVPEEDSRG